MARPILFDATFTAARLRAEAPSGIERVDAAFAGHFLGRGEALHYGLRQPHRLATRSAARLLAEAGRAWGGAHARHDPIAEALAAWLRDPAPARLRLGVAPATGLPGWHARCARTLARTRWRLRHDGGRVPDGAIVLNIAQYAFEYPLVFRWLDRRPDVKSVIFIHDLLPLDRPEFFRDGYRALFQRRVETMLRAAAVLVSNPVVGARVREEFSKRGKADVPVFDAPLPPPTGTVGPPGSGADGVVEAAPYFVAVGTIEPRKNHLLLLNLWRELAISGGAPPRLVLVGARGWDNEQTVDLLERGAQAPFVAEVSGLSTAGLRALLGGARALLLPSFAEGYGLPIAEALAEGVPVVASDIPVFRTVSQGCALLLDPLDGPGWRRAIEQITRPGSPLRADLLERAGRYQAPRWPDYFFALEGFLATL